MIRRALFALAAAALCAALLLSGLLAPLDNYFSDLLYQRPRRTSGEVMVIGIDERSLDALGPFQEWGREIFAQCLEMLNADPESRPAVIGVDIIFAGERQADSDAWLVEAADAHPNVVVASAVNFANELVVTDTGFYMDGQSIQSYDQPFSALAEVAATGHINTIYDSDGILRRVFWDIELEGGTIVPSFSEEIYRKYAEQSGLDAEITPPVDANGYWIIPYSAKPGGFDQGLSVLDLLMGNVPADMLADKIVLIGPYASGLLDQFNVPISHGQQMYGVEVQANAIEAFLQNRFYQQVAPLPQCLLVAFIVALCLLFFWGRGVLVNSLVAVALMLAWIGALFLSREMGYIMRPSWLPLPLLALYVGSLGANYMREASVRREITQTFQRYVAPEVVDLLLKEGKNALGLGGKLMDIAVLFVDIRGFTPMSELMEPPEVVHILNRYLSLTSACILRHNGMLDKFIGDATMAIWGAPLPQEDYIYKAVCAALDMAEESQAMREELQRRYGRDVSFGIGLHCGQAVVGNIGAAIRMDYTAIGDVVNTAARLESNAPAGKIYISAAIVEALRGRIRATSLGTGIKLKGKAAGFEIFTLDGLLADAPTAEK